MRKIIKECLIIGVVIIALLVLCVPLLFKDKDLRQVAHFGRQMVSVPPLPQVQPVPANLPKESNSLLAPPDLKIFIPSEHQTASITIAAVHSQENHYLQLASNADQAWVVQLGSFSNAQSATDLVNQLNAKGYSAFAYPTNYNGQLMTRVYVGPVVKAGQAEALLNDLKNKLNLSGIIVSFDATNLH